MRSALPTNAYPRRNFYCPCRAKSFRTNTASSASSFARTDRGFRVVVTRCERTQSNRHAQRNDPRRHRRPRHHLVQFESVASFAAEGETKKQIILITGGNSGIGKTACEQLASTWPQSDSARGPAKAEQAKKEIIYGQPDADIVTMKSNCDLMDLREVQQYCKEVLEYLSKSSDDGEENVSVKKLDSLILNAGIMAAPYELTKQNHESHFGLTI